MKFLPLIWSGIWRKRGRTIFILLQVSVAFALFGVLQGMKTGVEEAIAKTRADLLMVFPDAFGEPPLPRAYLDELEGTAGVKSVTFADGILGNYQKPDQVVYVLGIEPTDLWLTLIPEIFKILPADLQALRSTRSGVLITSDIAKKYVVTADPGQAAIVAETIDRTFANAPSETSTASLRENAQQGMQSIGDLNFLIRSVVGAVFAALLFSIATMMMQGIRERTPEFGVLKTLGFTDRAVFILVVVEAVLVCLAGALIGLALAMVAFPYTAKWIPGLSMPLAIIEVAVAAACLVALVSAALPALRAARLRVVDALADR